MHSYQLFATAIRFKNGLCTHFSDLMYKHILSHSDLPCNIGVFSKWSGTLIEFSEFREFRESEESLKHELGSVKDLLCYLCLCGLVVSSLSLTQEILGSSPTLPFLYFLNFFCHWIQRIQWKHLEKTPIAWLYSSKRPKGMYNYVCAQSWTQPESSQLQHREYVDDC